MFPCITSVHKLTVVQLYWFHHLILFSACNWLVWCNSNAKGYNINTKPSQPHNLPLLEQSFRWEKREEKNSSCAFLATLQHALLMETVNSTGKGRVERKGGVCSVRNQMCLHTPHFMVPVQLTATLLGFAIGSIFHYKHYTFKVAGYSGALKLTLKKSKPTSSILNSQSKKIKWV